MSFTLRNYQSEAVTAALEAFKVGKPFIIQAATGAGKSLIIADLCHRLNDNVLILQPSKELLEQNYAKLCSYYRESNLDIGIYSASKNSKEVRKYTYATIGSIYKKPDDFAHFNHIIIDEADLVNPKEMAGMYQKFFKAIDCKSICGLTATPYRLHTKYFKDGSGMLTATTSLGMITRIGSNRFWSGGIVYKIETQELIDQGYLCPVKYFVEDVSLAGLKLNSTGSDYTADSLECFWDDTRIQKMAQIITKIDKGCQRNLIFCSSLEQAENVTEMLTLGGLSAAMVSAETPKKDREAIIADFRSGKIKHLVNMGVLTTGFDVPEIDSVVMARPTMSLRLYYQILGRGIRKDPARPDKVLRFFDLGGVVKRLGRVETIRITKEPFGWKDQVESEAGVLSGKPLFSYQIEPKQRGL